MENALSLKLVEMQPTYDYSLKAARLYEDAGFTKEKNVFFLSKAAEMIEQIQNFIILTAPSSFQVLEPVS